MRHKSLIIKLGAIGDVAAVLPAAWLLHQTGTEIHWLCGKVVAPLLSCYSWVNPIVVDEKRLLGGQGLSAVLEVFRAWRRMIVSSYDLCAILQYDFRYRILTLPVRARRSLTLEHDDRLFKLVSERHHSAEYARILCDLPDKYSTESIAPVAPDRLPSNPLPRNEKTRIALMPGGARNVLRDDPQRRWPLESYVALARLLLQAGHEVVLTGGPGDTWVEPAFAGLAVDHRVGQWSIPQTLAFYQSCDCVVTHDTGPMHLAGLAGCGLVALFGPTTPSKFLPRRNGVVALWGGERLPCRPCYDGLAFADCNWNGCMMAITPQRVAATVELLLAEPTAAWQMVSI